MHRRFVAVCTVSLVLFVVIVDCYPATENEFSDFRQTRFDMSSAIFAKLIMIPIVELLHVVLLAI